MNVFVSIPQGSEVSETFFPHGVRQYLEERHAVSWLPLARGLTQQELPLYAKDAEVIVTGWGHVPLTAQLLKQTKIRLIVHTGGSVGSLVDAGVYEHGTRVISGNNLYADSVAEGVLAYMLAALRKIPDAVNAVRAGGWSRDSPDTEGLLDRSVGIIGMGAISLRLMRLLQPFGVFIKIFSHYPVPETVLRECHAQQASLEEVFATCKIVSLHASMNEKTRGMIQKKHFDLLADGAIFVNTARGRIIKEDEMIAALSENRFRAILDVYEEEPLALDSPLRHLSNVYCMPHQAGPTLDRRAVIARHLIDNIAKFEAGEEMELEIGKEYARRMTVGG